MNATILAEDEAARARLEAFQGAAQSVNFSLPGEDPWTGRRSGEGWLDNQARTYGRYIDSGTEEKKAK
jgi:hypothetical protein